MDFAKPSGVSAHDRHRPYWQDLLANLSTASSVFVKAANQNALERTTTKIYASQSIRLATNLGQNIPAFCARHHLAVPTLFYAAWGLLLSRFSDETQLVFGSPLQQPVTELTSLAAQSLPIAITLTPQQTLLEFLQQLEQQLNASAAHCADFFSELATYKNALVAHMAKFTSLCYVYSSNATLKRLKLTEQAATVNLILGVHHSAELAVQLFYCPDTFAQTEITNLLAHFTQILHACLDDPSQTTTEFSLLTEKEQQTLYAWGNFGLLKQASQPPCVLDSFSQQVRNNPTALALFAGNQTRTYAELDLASKQLTYFLLAAGAQPGQPIAVALNRDINLITAMVAIFKLGAIYLALDLKSTQQRIAYILQDSQPTLILTDQPQLIPPAFNHKIVTLPVQPQHDAQALPAVKLPKIALADVAYLSYSADPTEMPKGTLVTHLGLANLAQWYQAVLKVTADDKAAQFARASYPKFFCEIWPFLACGASISLIDDVAKWAPAFFFTWLVEQGITICDLPTAYAQMLFALAWPQNLALRLVKISGENLSQYPAQIFPFDIWQVYGCTETSVESIFAKIYGANAPIAAHATAKPPIGRPIQQVEAYVVSQHGQLAPIGAIGELLLGGAGVAQGYLHAEKTTQEKFIAHPFKHDTQAKLYKTGDLVRWRPSGELEFIGQLNQQVNLLGFKVALNEVATQLNQLPDIAQVNVVAQEVLPGQKKLVAYVVPNVAALRIPYHTPCLVMSADLHCAEYPTENLSVGGVSLSGVSINWDKGLTLRLYLQLPGFSNGQWFTGSLVWQHGERVGIQFILTAAEQTLLQDSLAYYFSRNNPLTILEDTLLRRDLGRALRKKLPGYMVPTLYVPMPAFPLDARGKLDQTAFPLLDDRKRRGHNNTIKPQTPTEKALAVIWADLLGHTEIGITDDFFALGGNSLLVTALILKILAEFKLLMPITLFLARPVIITLADYIDSEGLLKPDTNALHQEAYHDATLAEGLCAAKASVTVTPTQAIFLTGATGFFGIHLLKELLNNVPPTAKIYCLIKAENCQMAQQQLAIAAEEYRLGKLATADRLVFLAGDLSQPYFGLVPNDYNTLASQITAIYHSETFHHKITTYANLRPTNVLGTLEVIKFALSKVNKPIHYISTLAAASSMDYANNLVEEFPGATATGITENYALSKWVAEKLLATAYAQGVPVNIYRTGPVIGQSATGVCNTQDALLLLLKGCAQLGYAPQWQHSINLLPVDYLSAAIVKIAQTQTPGVFHLAHPQGLPWLDLFSWLPQQGYALQLVAPTAWQTLLINQVAPSNALYPLLASYLTEETGRYDVKAQLAKTQALLATLGLPYPAITEHFLNNVFAYLRQVKFM